MSEFNVICAIGFVVAESSNLKKVGSENLKIFSDSLGSGDIEGEGKGKKKGERRKKGKKEK